MAAKKKTPSAKSIAALTPFQKGEQRAKDAAKKSHLQRKKNALEAKSFRETFLAQLDNETRKEIAMAMIKEAIKGNTGAFDRIMEVIQEEESGAANDGPAFNLVVPSSTAKLIKKIIRKK